LVVIENIIGIHISETFTSIRFGFISFIHVEQSANNKSQNSNSPTAEDNKTCKSKNEFIQNIKFKKAGPKSRSKLKILPLIQQRIVFLI
jgi:hypothetical protein